MDEPGQESRPRTLRPWSVRVRVVALMMALVATGLVAAGAVTFSVQFAELHQRVESELLQEVDEIRSIATQVTSDDGGPITDLDELFTSFLRVSVPGDDEWMLALIDGEAAYVPGGDPPFDLNQTEVIETALRVLEEGRANIVDLELDGRALRMIVSDVQIGDPRQGVLIVAIDVGSQRQAVWNTIGTYALVGLATLLGAGFAGHLVAGRLLRPLAQLREATAGIDTEDLTRRVEISSADNDVAQLSLNFNQMLDRLEAGFADQRRFLDDAAHELRTPLTIIRGNLELMAAEDPPDVEQTRELVLDELDRMKRMVDDLLLLAKSQRPDFVRMQPVDVAELAGELKDRVHLLGDRRWEASATAAGHVLADRQRLQQAVVQLAANAVKFTEPEDRIEMGVDWSPPTAPVKEQVEAPAERYLVITVRDTGTGIDPDQGERIFDRFARGDNVHGVDGSGLGLAIVQAIVRAHHGAVTLDSLPGRGSTFRLWIPDQGAII